MERFRDDWVLDRTMFDFLGGGGGGCSCCGMAHLAGQQLIGQCSDLDVPEAVEEDVHTPWPDEIKLSVWTDRVALRRRLKAAKPA